MKPITDEQLNILAQEISEIKNAEIVELSQRLQQAQVIINEAGTAVFSAWLEVAQLYKKNAELLDLVQKLTAENERLRGMGDLDGSTGITGTTGATGSTGATSEIEMRDFVRRNDPRVKQSLAGAE